MALLVTLFLRRRRRLAAIDVPLRLAVAALAVVAIFFVIRTGHLGAQLTWEQQGAPPGAGGPGPG